MNRILLGDDHAMARRGMRYIIQYYFNDTVIAEADSCNEIMNLLHKEKFTHVILDVVLGDGIILSILPNIKNLYPDISVAAFTVQPIEVYFPVMRGFGVEYYISKAATEEESLPILGSFFKREKPVEQLRYFVNPKNPFTKLSMTELHCLHYLLKWYSTKEISRILLVTSRRVLQIKQDILTKIGVPSFAELQELATIFNVS